MVDRVGADERDNMGGDLLDCLMKLVLIGVTPLYFRDEFLQGSRIASLQFVHFRDSSRNDLMTFIQPLFCP
jgi:hypothetical protein